MLNLLIFCDLGSKPESKKLNELVRGSRSLLLKVPEVLSVSSGRNLDSKSQWQFNVSIHFENRQSMATAQSDPNYLKFEQEILAPWKATFQETFETDPSKPLKYS